MRCHAAGVAAAAAAAGAPPDGGGSALDAGAGGAADSDDFTIELTTSVRRLQHARQQHRVLPFDGEPGAAGASLSAEEVEVCYIPPSILGLSEREMSGAARDDDSEVRGVIFLFLNRAPVVPRGRAAHVLSGHNESNLESKSSS